MTITLLRSYDIDDASVGKIIFWCSLDIDSLVGGWVSETVEKFKENAQ